jgi:hypothetical protein
MKTNRELSGRSAHSRRSTVAYDTDETERLILDVTTNSVSAFEASTGTGRMARGMPGRRMETLLRLLTTLGPAALATEADASRAVAAARWPSGVIPCPVCGAPCDRNLANLRCSGRRRHSNTIFFGTPLGTKLKPNVRATLFAVRAMTTTARSVSAAELARAFGSSHATLWRHLHSLRAALPRHDLPRKDATTRRAVRSWLNGTFHGVDAGWLHRYLQEIAARWIHGASLLALALKRYVEGGRAITLAAARAPS